ncbi:AraC family transcriptional regulator [Companilactobacillus hulinensis]|uniref:AraC family transcriptional regulator n=1 Tax=Companilactobacillus hulinensis TaxID=2486007 RepID=UPI000F771C25|nr:AraC family transcriptional regulator [Companilactobacillus hulinensis]
MKQIFMQHYPKYKKGFLDEEKYHLAYIAKITEEDSCYSRCMHCHEDILEISLILDGQETYFVDGNYYHIKKGDIFICGQNVMHQEGHTPPSICLGLKNFHIPKKILPKHFLITSCLNDTEVFNSLTDIANLAYDLLKKKDVSTDHLANQIVCSAIIPEIINAIGDAPIANQFETKKPMISGVKDYIDTNYRSIPNIQFLTKNVNISQSYLDHQFQNEYKCSPLTYLNSRRIGEAQTLLIMRPGLPITQIAFEVGFKTLSHFNHYFKDLSGISPLKFRQEYTHIE